jgi:hypothetical protein
VAAGPLDQWTSHERFTMGFNGFEPEGVTPNNLLKKWLFSRGNIVDVNRLKLRNSGYVNHVLVNFSPNRPAEGDVFLH